MFYLKLLGGASIEADGVPLAGTVAQRRRLALLGLLAASPPGGISRDRLATYLFPEADAARARGALSDALHGVRKSLGKNAVISAGDELRLDPAVVRSDVAEFEAALAVGDLRGAASLYRGPFLDGFFVSDAPEFERWVAAKRESFGRRYADVLEGLARQCEAAGDPTAQVQWLRKLAAHAPFDSGVATRLMQALGDAGDPGGALQQARTHQTLLREELGIEPPAEIEAIAARLKVGGHGGSSESASAALRTKPARTPESIASRRPDVPPSLAELVMRCLEKEANHRPQSATDLVRVLETVTSSEAGSPAMPAMLLAGRGMFRKALAWYAVALVAVAVLARAAVVGIGLPDWVVPGALVVMLLGLPVILFTGFVHHATRRVLTTTPARTPGGAPVPPSTLASIAVKASPHLTWKRTALGAVAALAAFTLLTAAWMASRALGIGPAASLMTAGVLGERERILVADFKSPASDTGVGPVVAEALRTDLAQSRNLNVVQPTTVREVLLRMQRPADARVDYALAREIAAREGIKAVVDGEVLQLGGSYIVAAKLVSAQSGDVLGTFRATAEDANGIIAAISELSREMRAKVGESLKQIRAASPLERVTTPSVEALRKYVHGLRAFNQGRFDKGVELLEEAIAVDTGFAMAYRKLSAELYSTGQFVARAAELAKRAYDHRDRLSEAERYMTIASYYTIGSKADLHRAVAAYEQLIDIQPENWGALTNLAAAYHDLRQSAKAEAHYLRALQASGEPFRHAYNGLISVRLQQSKWAEAERAIEQMEKVLPVSPSPSYWRAALSYLRGRYDSTEARIHDLRRTRGGERDVRIWAANSLAAMARLRGRLAEAVRLAAEVRSDAGRQGVSTAALNEALGAASTEAWYRGNGERALQMVDDALETYPLDRIPAVERPYGTLVFIYATVRRPNQARASLAEFERSRVSFRRTSDERERHTMAGHIALAERRYADAVREFRAADEGLCIVCPLPNIARAHDLAGEADSAIAVFTRYVETPDPYRWGTDATFLAGTYKRLGELWEAKGDRARAATYYAKFVELWKGADPELQPNIARVRRRLSRLLSIERR